MSKNKSKQFFQNQRCLCFIQRHFHSIYLLRTIVPSLLLIVQFWTVALGACLSKEAGVCTNCQVDFGEECDDGNLQNNDGCSSNCKLEDYAVQEWFNSPGCTGKIIKRLAMHSRDYRIAVKADSKTREAIVPYIAGICSSKIPCLCSDPSGSQDYPVPYCTDGSSAQSCQCVMPECSMIYQKCAAVPIFYGAGGENNKTFHVSTLCFNEFPRLPTSSQLSASPSRTFVIIKEWRLTFSGSKDRSFRPDISAWELTRSRALCTGMPDFFSAFASNICVPEYSPLDATAAARLGTFQIHDAALLRTRRNCTDPLCATCGETVYTSAACAPSLSCQLLAPGRCLVCTGGLATLPIQGFTTWPGPPAPPAAPDRFQQPGQLLCQPCGAAPDNFLYGSDLCRAGLGCGACRAGMACGACGQKDAPATACGDPRQGGRPFYWTNRYAAHPDSDGEEEAVEE